MFLPEDICNRSPGISAEAPRETTPPPPLLVDQQTACCSFTDSTVLWKLHAKQSSYSSTRLLTCPSQALSSAKVSPTRPACMPLSQRYNRRSILARISMALQATSVFVKTTWEKTWGFLELHFWLSTPRHSTARTAVNRHPTFPGGVE